jgi:hypothetical protein
MQNMEYLIQVDKKAPQWWSPMSSTQQRSFVWHFGVLAEFTVDS